MATAEDKKYAADIAALMAAPAAPPAADVPPAVTGGFGGYGPPAPLPPTGPDDADAAVAEADAMNRARNGGQPVVDPRQAQMLAAKAGNVGPLADPRAVAASDASAYAPGAAPAPAGVVRAQPAQQPQPAPAVPSGPPPIVGELGATYDAQGRAIQQKTGAEMVGNNAGAIGDARVAQEQERQTLDTARRTAELAQQSERQLAEVHRMSDDAAKMGVDPSRWWHNQGTGDKVRYTLAAMLGGFAAGWTHGPNLAMNQINKYIDDDIASQRTAIEQAHGKVTDARGVLTEMYQRFGTLDKADAATRLLKLNAMINDTKAQQAAAQSPAIEANGNIALAELQREKLLAQQKFMAAPAAGVKLADLHALSKDLEGDRSVAGAQAIGNLEAMDPSGQGEIPGSSLGGRLLGGLAEPDEHGRRGFVGGIANAMRGTGARQAEGAMYQAAEATLPPSIRGSPEAVKSQMRALFGNGSPEDIKAGLERARTLTQAQRANAYAGQDPNVVQAYEALNGAYNRRSGPKPGLPSGSTP